MRSRRSGSGSRDLHDVIAHSLTVIGLQAGGVRRLLRPEQEREREALLLVERTGRQAQEEMRHLLTLLRGRDGEPERLPQPGLEALPALVEDSRRAGLDACLRVTGDPAVVPPSVSLAAYRIVQEALTNARKHGRASHVDVQVDCAMGTLALAVTDDGSARSGQPVGNGYGLAGMRERAGLYGGTLEAGPRPQGGYRVATALRFPAGTST